MQKISLENFTFRVSRRGEQPRQVLVEKIMAELNIPRTSTWKGKETKNFNVIFFSGLADSTLEKLWQESRAWKVNPVGLFYKLLKQAKYEQHTHNTPK